MSGRYGSRTDEIYRRAGFGARVRRGTRPVLIVVDLTLGFTDPHSPCGTELSATVASTNRLVAAARGAATPIVFTRIAYTLAEAHGSALSWLTKAPGMRTLVEGAPAVLLDERLDRRDEDHVVDKKGPSAFFGTRLAPLLADLSCDTVVVCGATTSGCVRASVVDAVQYGYAVLVPRDCVGDRARGPHDAALFDIDQKYGDVVDMDDALGYLAGTRT